MLHGLNEFSASLAQLVEHALRKRTVVGSIPTGGYYSHELSSQPPVLRASAQAASSLYTLDALASKQPTVAQYSCALARESSPGLAAMVNASSERS